MVPEVIDEDCIKCGLCENVCPALGENDSTLHLQIYAGQCMDNTIVNNSSSGGIFYSIASSVIDNGGIVYGAAIDYDDSCKVKHVRVADKEELQKLQGSKYVQSDMSGVFSSVRNDLKTGNHVLFSGTPCQVLGLKKFLRKEYENLLAIDIICHGVPSPKVWNDYIKHEWSKIQEQNNNQNVVFDKISFRDKRIGWKNYGFSINYSYNECDNDITATLYYDRYKNPYMKGFLSDLYLRNSCYNCPVKNFSSGADITLADAWGIENFIDYSPETIGKGISLIMLLTEKGQKSVAELPLNLVKLNSSIIEKHNQSAFRSSKPHKKRKKFFRMLQQGVSMPQAVEACLPEPTYINKVVWSINNKVKKIWSKLFRPQF